MREIRPEGPINLTTVPALSVSWVALASPEGIKVNLSAATEVDSSSLALLIGTRRAVEAAGGVFEVQHVPAAMKTLANLYGVNFIVENTRPYD